MFDPVERFEDLIDTHACNDYATTDLCEMVVTLEQKLQFLKDMLYDRHCDEEEIEEALSRFDS